MPRMRTIQEAYAWVKETDPNTALTLHAIRRLVTTGKIPSTTIGVKYLINLDVLEAYLAGELAAPRPLCDEHNGIRRLEA